MKRKVLVVIALSALVLTGCSQVNTAAKVGSVEITNNQVQTSINEILKERSKFDMSQSNAPTGQKLNQTVLQFHLFSQLFDAIAAGTKLDITDGDLAKERAALVAQVGGDDKLPYALANASVAVEDFPRYVRSVVVVSKLKAALVAAGDTSTDGSGLQKLVIAASQKEGVEVNPRYGSWNPATGSLDAPISNPVVETLK